MVKTKSSFLKSIFVIFSLLMISATVFAYSTNSDDVADQETTISLFDCSSEKTPLSERLKLKYNNDNAMYISPENVVTLNYSSTNIDITVSDKFLKYRHNFLQTGDYATSCIIIPIDAQELKEANRYIKQGDTGTLVNGNVISTINVLQGNKLELCINRPVTTLNDSERIIQNKSYLDNKNKKKVFTIKQKRKWWFDKKIADFTVTLNVNLEPLGCIDKDAVTTPEDTSEFLPKTETAGTCYNPHGTAITGLTGEENYEKYGFDKLFFTYEEQGIAHNSFDYGEHYVDQDQLKYALFLKGKLLEQGQTITLDGITFTKSEKNAILPNYLLYFDSKKMNIQANNLITSEFTYSSDPEIYYNTIISTLNKIPEELRKFVIIDVILNDKEDSVFLSNLTESQIKERIKIISGNSNYSYSPQKEETDKANYYGYQISMYSFLNNQAKFKEYIKSKPKDNNFKATNLVFLKQLMENIDIYYGDSVTPVLINTKPYGSLETGLTKEIFESVRFMSNIDKQIKLATDSEIKQIDSPGLYVFDLKLDGKNITYNVKNADDQTKKFLDYYNQPENADYKKNALFTNTINAMYYDYGDLPIRLHDGKYGEKSKSVTVYKDFSDWPKIQNGYVVSFKLNNNKLEDIIFKDIRPIQITAPSGYTYKYINKNGRYSEPANRTGAFKETLFVFLENKEKEPQLILTSSSPISLNLPISPNTSDGIYTYNIPKSIKSDNPQGKFIYSDLFSGIETNNIGFTMSLVTKDRVCFNITEDSINFWLNPEYTFKK
ncbi:MAG TPA: hypothetical protein PK655_02985 [archaeon]|nr:hypothetical protein [archaeon]HPV66390.1 hypothetical protein [archaeon]